MEDQKVRTEEIKAQGEQVVAKVKELIQQGNVRRITVKNEEGKVLMDIPLTLGVIGALLLPQLAALGLIAALVTNCRLSVEKVEEDL